VGEKPGQPQTFSTGAVKGIVPVATEEKRQGIFAQTTGNAALKSCFGVVENTGLG